MDKKIQQKPNSPTGASREPCFGNVEPRRHRQIEMSAVTDATLTALDEAAGGRVGDPSGPERVGLQELLQGIEGINNKLLTNATTAPQQFSSELVTCLNNLQRYLTQNQYTMLGNNTVVEDDSVSDGSLESGAPKITSQEHTNPRIRGTRPVFSVRLPRFVESHIETLPYLNIAEPESILEFLIAIYRVNSTVPGYLREIITHTSLKATGSANGVLRDLSCTPGLNWNTLRTTLTKYISERDRLKLKYTKLYQFQQPGESFRVYTDRLKDNGAALGVAEAKLVAIVLSGANPSTRAFFVFNDEPTTLEGLERLVREVEQRTAASARKASMIHHYDRPIYTYEPYEIPTNNFPCNNCGNCDKVSPQGNNYNRRNFGVDRGHGDRQFDNYRNRNYGNNNLDRNKRYNNNYNKPNYNYSRPYNNYRRYNQNFNHDNRRMNERNNNRNNGYNFRNNNRPNNFNYRNNYPNKYNERYENFENKWKNNNRNFRENNDNFRNNNNNDPPTQNILPIVPGYKFEMVPINSNDNNNRKIEQVNKKKQNSKNRSKSKTKNDQG